MPQIISIQKVKFYLLEMFLIILFAESQTSKNALPFF